jgi:hypothetical protein
MADRIGPSDCSPFRCLLSFMLAGIGLAPPPMPFMRPSAITGMLLPFLRLATISSGGVKLKSLSISTTSCWSGRSRWSRMINGASSNCCS